MIYIEDPVFYWVTSYYDGVLAGYVELPNEQMIYAYLSDGDGSPLEDRIFYGVELTPQEQTDAKSRAKLWFEHVDNHHSAPFDQVKAGAKAVPGDTFGNIERYRQACKAEGFSEENVSFRQEALKRPVIAALMYK